MKVKNIFITLGLLTVLFFTSCVEDLGNYEYQDPETVLPVTISGIQDTILILKGEYLVLDPEVTIAGDQSNYTYSWYVMPSVTAGFLPTKTVWGNTKNLNQQVTLAVGRYFLNLVVTDSIRDIYIRKQVILDVKATEIGAGWYVLKDVDNETDFDYVNDNGVIYPDVLLTLAEPAGSRLKGSAVKIEYQPTRYYNQVTDENGKVTTLSNQSVYHILSDEDIKVFDSKTLKLFKNQQDVFYTPTVCRPQNIAFSSGMYDLFLVNDGTVSAIYGIMANVGKLSPKAGLYTFHKDLLVHLFGGAMGFDLDNRTFYHVNAFAPALTTFTAGPISTTNMDATLLNLLYVSEASRSGTMTGLGFAVMKNVNKEEYYLATLLYSATNNYPIMAFDTVPAGSKFPTAPVKAAPYSGSFVYFADGNRLSVYKNAPGLSLADRETLLKEFPAGETISHIYNVYKPGSFNYMVVLTNSSNGWKLYAFNVIGLGNPEFEATPQFVREGKGNAKYFMYRP